jgi:hypothetical protein
MKQRMPSGLTERKRLLETLAERAMDFGADVLRFESKVSDLSEVADAKLIVVCDAAVSAPTVKGGSQTSSAGR